MNNQTLWSLMFIGVALTISLVYYIYNSSKNVERVKQLETEVSQLKQKNKNLMIQLPHIR